MPKILIVDDDRAIAELVSDAWRMMAKQRWH